MAPRPNRSFGALFAKTLTVLATTSLVLVSGMSGPAQAHGSVTDPPSRNYGCWDRWGSDHLNPNMAATDPMCAQAWRADPNTMWNWNGLYREGVAGNHQGAIPNGQLCSGGRAENGRYNSLDTVGAWQTVNKPSQFTLTLTDGARHGADYLRIYITRQGVNTATTPLRWSDLELVTTTGRIPPGEGIYTAQVNAGNRTGRHVVYTVWQASHLDQSYYLCSDVNFGGSGSNPPPPPPPPTVTPTVAPTATPPPTTNPPANPGTGSCSATLRTTSTWSGGFQAEVTVTAGAAAIRSWNVGWNQASGQSINSLWSGTQTVTGSAVSVRNAAWNGALAAGQSATFGFVSTGTASTPTLTCAST